MNLTIKKIFKKNLNISSKNIGILINLKKDQSLDKVKGYGELIDLVLHGENKYL